MDLFIGFIASAYFWLSNPLSERMTPVAMRLRLYLTKARCDKTSRLSKSNLATHYLLCAEKSKEPIDWALRNLLQADYNKVSV